MCASCYKWWCCDPKHVVSRMVCVPLHFSQVVSYSLHCVLCGDFRSRSPVSSSNQVFPTWSSASSSSHVFLTWVGSILDINSSVSHSNQMCLTAAVMLVSLHPLLRLLWWCDRRTRSTVGLYKCTEKRLGTGRLCHRQLLSHTKRDRERKRDRQTDRERENKDIEDNSQTGTYTHTEREMPRALFLWHVV